MRGRKPVPTHLKLLSGNPGGRPLHTNEPQPEGELYAPPAWLSDRQKEIWRAAIEAAPTGLLKNLDSGLLVKWVIAEDMHRDATEKVNQFGMVVKAPSGVPIQSPFLSIINRQAEISMRAAAELGFSPASRVRVGAKGATAHKGNLFAKHLARRDKT